MKRALCVLCLFAAVVGGCLTRPVEHTEPSTKVSSTFIVRQSAIDKVDLLFSIDNSASMGDKSGSSRRRWVKAERPTSAVPPTRFARRKRRTARASIVTTTTRRTSTSDDTAFLFSQHRTELGIDTPRHYVLTAIDIYNFNGGACPMETEKIDWVICGNQWETVQAVGNNTNHFNITALVQSPKLTLTITCPPNFNPQNWTYDVTMSGLVFYLPQQNGTVRASTYTKM